MDSETERYKIQMIIIFSALGIATTCLGKVAIGVTMVRIIGSMSPWKRWAILVLLGFMTLFSLTDIMLYLFRCGDPRAQWDHRLNRTATCLPIAKTGLFNAITNGILVFADYFLSVLPMAVIWGLQMPLARRLAINGLIGLTIITGVAGTIKLVHVSRLDEDNINGGLYDSLIWCTSRAHVLLCLCPGTLRTCTRLARPVRPYPPTSLSSSLRACARREADWYGSNQTASRPYSSSCLDLCLPSVRYGSASSISSAHPPRCRRMLGGETRRIRCHPTAASRRHRVLSILDRGFEKHTHRPASPSGSSSSLPINLAKVDLSHGSSTANF